MSSNRNAPEEDPDYVEGQYDPLRGQSEDEYWDEMEAGQLAAERDYTHPDVLTPGPAQGCAEAEARAQVQERTPSPRPCGGT